MQVVLFRSAKTQLVHCCTQKTKRSLTTAILIRALVQKTITAPQAKRLVQLGISYQTLQDIRRASSTDADFEGELADRGVRSRLLREKLAVLTRTRDRDLLCHTSCCIFIFFTNRVLKVPHIQRNHQTGCRPWDLGKFIKASHLSTYNYIAAS